MTVRLAINGFGRIGRLMLRHALTDERVEPVAINAGRGDPETLAQLFRYDSVHGRWPGSVKACGDVLRCDGATVHVLRTRDVRALPWGALGIDVVAEATGSLTTRDAAAAHLDAGASRVVVTAPAAGADATVVPGVNDGDLDPESHRVVSGASCTTNCLAPMAMVLHRRFGIQSGSMTTIHAYTRDQELVDSIHDDPRRARSAAQNLVPTTTGAASSLGLVLPDLAGRLSGIAVRVPVADVSLVDLVVRTERPATAREANDAFRIAAGSRRLAGVLGVCDEPLVSSDFRGDTRSCVIDLPSTRSGDDNLLKVLAWYDNEAAYAARMIDLVLLVAGAERLAAPRRHPVAV